MSAAKQGAKTHGLFLTDLHTVKRRSRRQEDTEVSDRIYIWRLIAPLRYKSPIAAELGLNKGIIEVPEGFITDFASVPRLPLAFLLTGDTVHAPAVVHDWLVRVEPIPRAQADRIFLEAMEADDVPVWRRYLMYWAVCAATAWIALTRRG